MFGQTTNSGSFDYTSKNPQNIWPETRYLIHGSLSQINISFKMKCSKLATN